MTIGCRARLLCAASSLAMSATVATAQVVEETGAFLLETIVISGELQDRAIQDTQTSVAVETGASLEARGDLDFYDFVERVPNVGTTFGNKGFTIRGIQQSGSGVQPNGMLISVQVDGAALANPQSTFFAPFSTWDVDQFEVLRGPQSTQQGRNALAGAVIVNTRDPEFFEEYRFRAEVGSRNTQRAAFALNTPLLDDTLAFRLVGETSSTDGWVRSETLNDDEYDAREYESLRAKLRWKPNAVFDSVLSFSYTDSSGGEDYVLADRFPEERVTLQNAPAVEGSIHRQVGLNMSYELNPSMTLTSETTFYRQDYERIEGDVNPNVINLVEIFGGSEAIEQDFQLSFESGRFTGVVGFFYTEVEDSRPFDVTFDIRSFIPVIPQNLLILNRDETFDSDVQNLAIYGETDIDAGDLLPGLSFIIGARYDRESYSFRQSVDYGPDLALLQLLGFVDVPERTGDFDFDAFLPKVGVIYEFNQDQSVSFTVQRGYRAGGVSSNTISNELSEFDPEFTTNYEFAYRGSFNEDRLRVRANVYYTRWTDQQVQVLGNNTANPLLAQFDFDTANAGESELYGLELTVEAEPTDNLSVFGSLGLSRTEYLDFQDAGQDFTGNEFPFAPEVTAAVGGQYRWDNGMSVGLDAAYTGSSFQNNANTFKDDARLIFNAQATYEMDNGVTAGLYVRNITDVDYETARFESPGAPTIVRTGEPRTIGVFLQAEF